MEMMKIVIALKPMLPRISVILIIDIVLMFLQPQTVAQIFRNTWKRDGWFKIVQRDSRLDAVVLESVSVTSLAHCANVCIGNEQCKSINYKTGTVKLCEVLSQSRQELGEVGLKTKSGWKHYEPVQNQESPSCRNYPCGNFEKCVKDCTKVAKYRCVALSNIARGKQAANAPSYSNIDPRRALDGNLNTNYGNGSCAHTGCCSPMPWWRVDFGQTATVYSMKITNRGDCCGERLSNFDIRVGESSQGRGELNVACKQHVGVAQGATGTFVCRPRLAGRYLYILSHYNGSLALCEVEVFGDLPSSA
eukprot:gene14222-15705_t